MQRVLVIGARRRRQGIGEFVTRFFARHGARVCAVVGSSPESADLARRTLTAEAEPGLESLDAYADVEEALARERPDVVAVCSPYELHREHLQAVARAGAHCLCEKPLWWNEPAPAAGREAETAALVEGFAGRGLLLELVTQWPCTLPDFYRLWPEERGRPVERFEMLLSPTSSGHEMVLDSAPHPLSILSRLVGHGSVGAVSAVYRDAALRSLDLGFVYREAEARCRLVAKETQPRPAGYALNGRGVRREIELPEYAMAFVEEGGGRRIRIGDPLASLVAGFLERSSRGAATDRQTLIESVTNLEALVEAARRAEA